MSTKWNYSSEGNIDIVYIPSHTSFGLTLSTVCSNLMEILSLLIFFMLRIFKNFNLLLHIEVTIIKHP